MEETRHWNQTGMPTIPYLFIIYMTVLLHNVKQDLRGSHILHRVEGTNFDEILFADDTICITESTRIMNKMLKAIGTRGGQSGMKLNKGKCELLQFGGKAKVRVEDQTHMKEVDTAKYLGCHLNKDNNPLIEVRGRIRDTMVILKKLHAFWRHSNCNIKFKLNAIQAIQFAQEEGKVA